MLAFTPAEQVLIKDIWLKVAIQNGQLEVKEVKPLQKVHMLL